MLRVLIQCLLSKDNSNSRSDKVSRLVSGINPGSDVGGRLAMVVADRVSRLVSGINPGPVVSEVIFTCLGKAKETLIEYR